MKVGTLFIGSGVAATAISQRLLKKDPNASILILEAGVRTKTMDFGLWENYVVTGQLPYQPYEDLVYPQRDNPGENASVGGTDIPLSGARVFTYGGSTMHWGGWSFRLKPEDFHLFSNTGQVIDWPFGYETLEPYYCQAEHHLAVSGDSDDPTVPRSEHYPFNAFPYTLEDQPAVNAFHQLGIDYSHVPIARRGVSSVPSHHAPCQTTGTCKYCPFGARYVASNYMDDMRAWNDYPNLDVKLGAVVLEVRMAGRRAAGVTYIDRTTGERVVVDADRVIVAGGTIESAKLLLRSKSADWPDGVGNQSDMVGRHFITHPYFVYTGTLNENPLRLQPEMNFPTLVSRYYDSAAEQKKGKFVLVNPPDPVEFYLAPQMQAGKSRETIDAMLTGSNKIQMHGMIEVFGRFDNRVTNLPKLNHMGMPETIVDYTKDSGFDDRMKELQLIVTRIFVAMGATLTDKPSISWRADHAASTCRMSVDEKQGVVDANLRVHGTENLYVCSNATFPNIGSVNPTLTLTALSLRLGDHLNDGAS
ncbi:MAG: hypothetical protein QOI24_4654 [Acidobacteriota bacterium]|jgi:choline dehydrogenase-like flavoprotein|nr:hypothetical protein [Acidobacteriota bacterium]